MHHLDQEISRNQVAMMALDEKVLKDSFARLVDCFVDALPLEDLGTDLFKKYLKPLGDYKNQYFDRFLTILRHCFFKYKMPIQNALGHNCQIFKFEIVIFR